MAEMWGLDGAEGRDARYSHLLDDLRSQSEVDGKEGDGGADGESEGAIRILIEAIPKEKKSIKWLAAGVGQAQREADTLRLLSALRPGLKVELLEIYEPSRESCEVLGEKVRRSREAGDGVWSSVGEVVINERLLLPNTDLGRGKRFDLVTLPHVTYFMPDRVGVFKRIAGHLAPGGVIWIHIWAEKNKADGTVSHHHQVTMALTHEILGKKVPINAEAHFKELQPAAKEFGLTPRLDTYKWELMVGQGSKLDLNVLGIILNVEFRDIPDDAMDFLRDWVRKNGLKKRGDRLALVGVAGVLTFKAK